MDIRINAAARFLLLNAAMSAPGLLTQGTLRWAVRTDGSSGFVFLHNFQDHVEYHDLPGLHLELRNGNETSIRFPPRAL